MSPNQNISIWMAPLSTEISVTHPHIMTPSLFLLLQVPFTTAKVTVENSKVNAVEVNTNNDISDMDLWHFTHDTSSTRAPPFIEKEFEKEWRTILKVFPELSDNHRDPAIVPLVNHSTTHTSPSTHYYTTPSITPTTISHIHPQTISCPNITTFSNTSESANTTLSTTPTTISTTTTPFIEPPLLNQSPPPNNTPSKNLSKSPYQRDAHKHWTASLLETFDSNATYSAAPHLHNSSLS